MQGVPHAGDAQLKGLRPPSHLLQKPQFPFHVLLQETQLLTMNL